MERNFPLPSPIYQCSIYSLPWHCIFLTSQEKKRLRVMLSPCCLLCILYGLSKTLLVDTYHIFTVISSQSQLNNQSMRQISSTLMTEAHLQEFEIESIYLIHWNQSTGQTVKCFEDSQDISPWTILLPMSSTLHCIFWSTPEWQIVTFGDKW